MSDRLSPENLGKELYIQCEIFINSRTPQEIIADWNMHLNSGEKKAWAQAAEGFCKSLKAAEADS
jgi:hypothetical protein